MLFGSKKGKSSKKEESKKKSEHTAYSTTHHTKPEEHHHAPHPHPPEHHEQHKTVHHKGTAPHHHTPHATHHPHRRKRHDAAIQAIIIAVFAMSICTMLFVMNERLSAVIHYQNSELSPALEEFSRWSQARGLIQPTHIAVQAQETEEGIILEENLVLRGLQGPSMEPSIFPGNTLLLRPVTDKTAIREGHIVRFNYGDETYVHRVLAAYENRIITQGDNSLTQESISREDITHIVVGVLYT